MDTPIFSVSAIAAALGYLATQTIDIVKPWLVKRLDEGIRERVMRLVTVMITAAWAAGGGFAAERLGLLEPGGMWLVIVATFPALGGWYQVESRRKALKPSGPAPAPPREGEEEAGRG